MQNLYSYPIIVRIYFKTGILIRSEWLDFQSIAYLPIAIGMSYGTSLFGLQI